MTVLLDFTADVFYAKMESKQSESKHYLFLHATHLFPHGATIVR